MPKAKRTSTGRRLSVSGSAVVLASVLVSGCSTVQRIASLSDVEPIERVVGPHDPVTPGGGRYQVGRAYSVGGRTYVPREDPNYDSTGIASWYGGDFHHGTRTANGEVYDRGTLSAAHPTMPLPSYARVTNLRNGRSIVVRVNDRGPYAANRIIDVSEKTAELLDMKRHGVGGVRVQYIGRAGLAGSDQRVLAATLRGPGIVPGLDERRLLASADLPAGPRRDQPATTAPTLVADAGPILPPAAAGNVFASRMAPPRPPVLAAALVPTTDAASFELAGVDAKAMRAAMAALPRPAASSAEVIASNLPAASGAPMSILPQPDVPANAAAYAPVAVPLPSPRSSFVAESRIAAAHAIFAGLEGGTRFSELAGSGPTTR
ncbi:septal ring lytic transglycosylase RlpA family protein [Siculibacillus lacustris]|uniref:Endolytic peptidoglycan transglycosylase RlpA n=1 Tax=Siculibacillus lacustris TaxID=1549641 RepID=A0A4Q9VPY6_9HYPH|nr:septal ring lytic transglycosylase RlpA family protein [Siculibacillus lacustris]TBW37001.1 septal ring lytic transglycosylase RlpA family protein [Siculibacillus lacustris]